MSNISSFLSSPVNSYQVVLNLFKSCQILSNPVKSCQFLPIPVKSSQILSSPVKSCQIPTNPVKFCQIVSSLAQPVQLFLTVFIVLFFYLITPYGLSLLNSFIVTQKSSDSMKPLKVIVTLFTNCVLTAAALS